MNILMVADTHGRLMQRDIAKVLDGRTPDVVFLLGDMSVDDVEALQDFEGTKNVPMYGVIGNHDSHDLLSSHGITDLHLKTMKIGEYVVGGFGGSIRYKDDPSYLMYTNPQSDEILSDFAGCDIFLTHDKPCFKPFPLFKNIAVHAHSGLTGIAKYIERCQPAYAFHGHMHDRYTETHKGTKIRCCYDLEWIELP